MKLINLTEKTLTIHRNGTPPLILEPSGRVAKVVYKPQSDTQIWLTDGTRVPIYIREVVMVSGLPEQDPEKDDSGYVVTSHVIGSRSSCPARRVRSRNTDPQLRRRGSRMQRPDPRNG